MSNTYTVRVDASSGCRIITGSLPVADFAALVEAWSRRSEAPLEVDGKAAGRIGALAVVGTKAQLDEFWAIMPGGRREGGAA